MLRLIRKCFMSLFEVLAWIFASVLVIGGGILGFYLCYITGAILGVIAGFIVFCMTFGVLATFLSLAKDTREINEKFKKVAGVIIHPHK